MHRVKMWGVWWKFTCVTPPPPPPPHTHTHTHLQVISLQVRSNLLEGAGVIVAEDSRAHTRRGNTSVELPYMVMLNRNLPPNIQVLGWTDAPSAEFSARFNCKARVYKYFFPKGNMDLDVR